MTHFDQFRVTVSHCTHHPPAKVLALSSLQVDGPSEQSHTQDKICTHTHTLTVPHRHTHTYTWGFYDLLTMQRGCCSPSPWRRTRREEDAAGRRRPHLLTSRRLSHVRPVVPSLEWKAKRLVDRKVRNLSEWIFGPRPAALIHTGQRYKEK